MHDLRINRRDLLRALLAGGLTASLPATATTSAILSSSDKPIGWKHFIEQMGTLSDRRMSRLIDAEQVAATGEDLLRRLDTDDADYSLAVEQSYESGNSFWLWQRLLKSAGLNGGILNIDSSREVQLHDHPGATGVLRILDGVAEVWQFDVLEERTAGGQAVLRRTSHRVLRPGDSAVLTPGSGNIHALRSLSEECSMLDFFIPPYQKSRRTWYEPTENNWHSMDSIVCRQIAEHEHMLS